MRMFFYSISVLVLMLTGALLAGCKASKMQTAPTTVLADSVDNKFFHAELWAQYTAANTLFTIRVINKVHSTNPLRYIASDLESYQLSIGTLMTQGKGLFKLSIGGKIYYPVAFNIIPGYGVVPVDEIVLGFGPLDQKQLKKAERLLLYDQPYFFDRSIVFKA